MKMIACFSRERCARGSKTLANDEEVQRLFSPAFIPSLTTNHLSIIASTICNFLAATKSPQLASQ
jgi:hypothetical protein